MKLTRLSAFYKLKTMPEKFNACVKSGGRVRSKRLNKTQYVKICFKDGKSYIGEKHTYKKIIHKTNG